MPNWRFKTDDPIDNKVLPKLSEGKGEQNSLEDIEKDIEAQSHVNGAKEAAEEDRVAEIDVDMAVAEAAVARDKPDCGYRKA